MLSFQGGVGNQLFQWALMHALTAEGRLVLADRSRCRGDRPFVVAPLVSPDHLLGRSTGLALVALERAGRLRTAGFVPVDEPGFGYHSEFVRQLPRRAYLRGYFQSPQYFAGHEDMVRTRVRALLDSQLSTHGAELAADLAADPHSVSLHIRRGDYLSDPAAAVKHGVLPLDYYRSALESMDRLGHTRRIWFSDDLDWVRDRVARPGDLLCHPDHTLTAAGEIALMASCRNHVIANSSFSWWGAWLGRPADPRHPVIAPARWFSESADTQALIPQTWQQL